MGTWICQVIRENLLKGIYPSRFLHNKIVPIPKKGDLSLIKNNRFLSVPSIWASLQGKFVASCLNDFIEKRKILWANQYGFI